MATRGHGPCGLTDLTRRVAKGKDDRTLVDFRHELDNVFGKRSADCRKANETGGPDMADDIDEGLEPRRVRLFAGQRDLVFGKLVSAIVRNKSL
jgi:hypothetical protein